MHLWRLNIRTGKCVEERDIASLPCDFAQVPAEVIGRPCRYAYAAHFISGFSIIGVRACVWLCCLACECACVRGCVCVGSGWWRSGLCPESHSLVCQERGGRPSESLTHAHPHTYTHTRTNLTPPPPLRRRRRHVTTARQVIKFDLQEESYTVHSFSGGAGDGHGTVMGGESMFARRSGGAEDDGWLLSFT
jgi:carotenoid cleavage dioxygenase-like enzyme